MFLFFYYFFGPLDLSLFPFLCMFLQIRTAFLFTFGLELIERYPFSPPVLVCVRRNSKCGKCLESSCSSRLRCFESTFLLPSPFSDNLGPVSPCAPGKLCVHKAMCYAFKESMWQSYM
ncbi:unnamed protein product [Durusdinium trenchii]|uniref:Secreted protein n=1 Tax=Durusdinium trenchii TaxID=1381693 RepID=A0ABP0LE43_9DINO